MQILDVAELIISLLDRNILHVGSQSVLTSNVLGVESQGLDREEQDQPAG